MEKIEGPYLLSSLWQLCAWHEPPAWFLPLASSWLIWLVLLVLGALAVRRRQLQPHPLQNAVELALEGIRALSLQLAGPEGPRFLPFFATLFLFILCSNLSGLIPGFASPTTNINVNAAMAILVLLTSIALAIQRKGLLGFLKHLCGPPYWLAPFFFMIR